MRVTVTRITRGFEKKISFAGPGDTLMSVSAPAHVTVDVEHDPDKQTVEEVIKRVGPKLYEMAKELSLSDLEQDYGAGARSKLRIPRAGGDADA